MGTILIGDVIEKFKEIPDESIDCIITSPPYWGLRNYGIEGQMGLEKDFNEYLDKLDLIMDECWRVLKPTGTCWINLGDTYSTVSGGMRDLQHGIKKKHGKVSYGVGHAHTGDDNEALVSAYSVDQTKLYSNLKHKSRVGIPERFYIRCIDKGWVARNHIPWIKANSMPSSVRDRFTNKWESIFFFAKKPKGYYFDLDAVRVAPKTGYGMVKNVGKGKRKSLEVLKQQENMSDFGFTNKHNYGLHQRRENGEEVSNCHPLGKNPGDVFRDKAVYDKSKPYAVVEREGVIYYRNTPPLNELIDYLTEARKKIGMSIDELENIFGNYTPHHWFDRGYGSYPTKEDWIKAKEILKFDDKYDGVMTTEYIKDAEKINNPIGKNPGDVFRDKYGSIETETKYRQGMNKDRGNNLIEKRNLPDQKEFVDKLRESFTVDELVQYGLTRTTVEHWFRYDDSGFAYPDAEDWKKVNTKLFPELLEVYYMSDDIDPSERILYNSNAKTKDITSPSGSAERTLVDLNTNVERNMESRMNSVINGKNPGDIFEINTKPCKEAHFATFPPTLPEKILKCACPKQVCKKCGQPREKITEVVGNIVTENMRIAGCNKDGKYFGKGQKDYKPSKAENPSDAKRRILESMSKVKKVIGYKECDCKAGFEAGTVLDPFFGAGTVGMVAEQLDLNWVGIEINPEYVEIAKKRIGNQEKLTKHL